MSETRNDWAAVPMPWSTFGRAATASAYALVAADTLTRAFLSYSRDFSRSVMSSTAIFAGVEAARVPFRLPIDTAAAYGKLLEANADLARRTLSGTLEAATDLARAETERATAAWYRTLVGEEGEGLDAYAERAVRVARALSEDYPAAIEAAAEDYGFHFERGHDPVVLETDRFILYRVSPNEPGVTVDERAKPLIILPPYVLGSNILAFLPKEGRSYAHAFANQGVPTYIRIQKEIATTEAVQRMTPEDDCRDTRAMCAAVMEAHGQQVTLNGYCQGGYTALTNLLSGELDGLVDALITCVSPMDGTKSPGLSGFLAALPPEFNDLAYGTKVLPSGVRVADGHLMGWVYKLKSIEQEHPLPTFLRDLGAFARKDGPGAISKSAAAINYWLQNERRDLPLPITEMSFASYNTPISDDGLLPVRLFGRRLELKRLEAKGIRWLICYGERDDLVEKEAALAPLAHVRAEATEFPRGHIAIATSWSHPTSACALHTVFGKGYRGPVRYQLDLDAVARKRDTRQGGRPIEVGGPGGTPREASKGSPEPKAKAAPVPPPVEAPPAKAAPKPTPTKKASVKPLTRVRKAAVGSKRPSAASASSVKALTRKAAAGKGRSASTPSKPGRPPTRTTKARKPGA